MVAIKKFYETNDTELKRTNIKCNVGKGKRNNNYNNNKKDRPYTHLEISKMLEKADQRRKIAILLMASAGIRFGAISSLRARKDINQNQSNTDRVVPITINPLNRQMLTNAIRFVSDGFLSIHPTFQNLIVQLRAAQHPDSKLIKNKMEGRSFDLIDSLFLAPLHYYFSLELQK